MGDGVTTKVQCSYSVKDDDITPDAVTYLWEDDLRIYCPTKKYRLLHVLQSAAYNIVVAL